MHDVTDRLPTYKKLFSLFNPKWAGNFISHIQIKHKKFRVFGNRLLGGINGSAWEEIAEYYIGL
jgi:hypothetical protein